MIWFVAYYSIASVWFVINIGDWFQAAPIEVEVRRRAARATLLTPVWPLVVLARVGRTVGQLAVDAVRRQV